MGKIYLPRRLCLQKLDKYIISDLNISTNFKATIPNNGFYTLENEHL
jgi:hypothetical protein